MLVDLLYLAHKSTFGHCDSLGHFMLAWIVLFEVPEYMAMAMKKGTQKYIRVFFQRST